MIVARCQTNERTVLANFEDGIDITKGDAAHIHAQGLDVQGTLVSIDAMGCQTSIAEQIVEQGGDYLFTLKSNQGKLCKAVEDASAETRKAPLGGLTFEKKRGRIEARIYHVLGAEDVSKAFPQWPELKTLGHDHELSPTTREST